MTWITLVLIIVGVVLLLVLLTQMLVNVRADEIAIIERRFIWKKMADWRTIALPGEVWIQAKTLAPGLHFLIPFIQKAKKIKFVTIGEDEVWLVTASTGIPIVNWDIMAAHVECDNFQDGVAFLRNGWQKWPQIKVLWPWQHRINLALFNVEIQPAIYIENDQVWIVNSIAWKPLTPGHVFARHVECDDFSDGVKFLADWWQQGLQLRILRPWLHRINTYMFQVRTEKAIVVNEWMLRTVLANDWNQIPEGRTLADKVEWHDNFQKADKFLENGGQRWRQIQHLMPGTYYINTDMFTVWEEIEWVDIKSDEVGIVTVLEGKPITDPSKIAADDTDLDMHQNFQDADVFLKMWWQKWLQKSVLRAAKYAINPRFATVKHEKMFKVPVWYCWVINSFIGDEWEDTTWTTFTHGRIVKVGQKWIWNKTLDPGQYPYNSDLMELILVPTTNIVLNWNNSVSETSTEAWCEIFDRDLRTIMVRSKDWFSFDMDVAQVINISSVTAPQVVARFGTVKNLVSQVLEPTIWNYFRNSAQTSEALDFVEGRSERQEDAKRHISSILAKYNIDCVDTLIGNINPPEELMKILADQKVAEKQQQMFIMQQKSEEKRQEYVKAQTAADKEAELTAAEFDKNIETQKAETAVERAKGTAWAKKVEAEAEAYVLRTVWAAKAEQIEKVWWAESQVIEKKTKAMWQHNFANVEQTRALAENNIAIVPKILVNWWEKWSATWWLIDGLLWASILKKDLFDEKETKLEKKEIKQENKQEKHESKQNSNDKKVEKNLLLMPENNLENKTSQNKKKQK